MQNIHSLQTLGVKVLVKGKFIFDSKVNVPAEEKTKPLLDNL